MGRPRVLHLIESLAPYGAEHVMLSLCTALREEFEPTVAACYGGELAGRLAEVHIPASVLCSDPDRPLSHLARWRFFSRTIRSLRPHLVHTHMAYANTLGRLAAHLQGIPTVGHLHGYEGKWGTPTYRLSYRLAQRGRTRLVAVSHGLAQAFHEVTGLEAQVVYNAVEEADFAPETLPPGDLRQELGLPPQAFLVGTTGRVAEVKNYPALLRCAQRVCASVEEAHFLCAGGGELLEEMLALRDRLGLASRVHFLGFRRDVARVLHDLDVFLLMSRGEGFGRGLVEAMWMRLPCVAADVMGVREVVEEGVTGFLVPDDDDEAAARRVLQLHQDLALRARLGEAGHARAAAHFSPQAFAESMSRLYRELLAGP